MKASKVSKVSIYLLVCIELASVDLWEDEKNMFLMFRKNKSSAMCFVCRMHEPVMNAENIIFLAEFDAQRIQIKNHRVGN